MTLLSCSLGTAWRPVILSSNWVVVLQQTLELTKLFSAELPETLIGKGAINRSTSHVPRLGEGSHWMSRELEWFLVAN